MQKRGMLIVISGFSGVGKSTVISHMFDAMPNLRFSVSCTSRKPRAGEKEGIDYYYVTEEEFARKVENNEFVEYTRTFTNCYGTLKCEIDRLLSEGYDILLDINSVGARNIKKVYPDAVTVFINPPSLEELKKRLVGRGSETPDSLKKRLDEIEFESKALTKSSHSLKKSARNSTTSTQKKTRKTENGFARQSRNATQVATNINKRNGE